jgi:hypothetical protein
VRQDRMDMRKGVCLRGRDEKRREERRKERVGGV